MEWGIPWAEALKCRQMGRRCGGQGNATGKYPRVRISMLQIDAMEHRQMMGKSVAGRPYRMWMNVTGWQGCPRSRHYRMQAGKKVARVTFDFYSGSPLALLQGSWQGML